MNLEPGLRLGDYELIRLLGAGGMGEVWLARDRRLQREAALKFLPAALTHDPARVARFHREARAASALSHPNACHIYGLGETTEGLHYIAMEYVVGETLRKRLTGLPFTVDEALGIVHAVAAALTAAHEKGIVHRDIKPENIIVRPDGLVKVLDFGLAKLTATALGHTDDTTEAGYQTASHALLGTVPYMSPEQARGDEVDGRSDIWSLGVVAYETISGRPPFAGRTPTDVLAAIISSEPPPLAGLAPPVSADVQRIVSKALQKDRRKRYQVMADLELDLEAARRSSTAPQATAATSQTVDQGIRGARVRRRTLAAIGLASLLALSVAVAVWWTRAHSHGEAVRSLAVLPLDNLSGDPGQEYFADGMTEALISALAQIHDLRVISRTSVMQFKATRRSVAAIGRDLDADAIIEGSIRRSGSRVGVTVQLIDTRSDRHIWGRSYDRELSDVLELHGDVARAVATEIRATLSLPRDSARKSIVPAAYDEYARGRYFWNMRNEESLQQGLAHFQRAIELDPSYAAAYSGVADSHFYLGYGFGRVPPREAMPLARAAALRSVALDPTLAEGRTSLALVTFIYDWEWAKAEQGFRDAIARNPSYSLAHHGYAVLLMTLGRPSEAVAETTNALAIDPLSIPINAIAGITLSAAGRHAEAAAQFRRTIELNPKLGNAHASLAEEYRTLGRNDEGLEEYLLSKQLGGEAADVITSRREAFRKSGWHGYWQRDLELALARYDGWHGSAFDLGLSYLRVGKTSQAMDWLEMAYKARSGLLVWLPTDDSGPLAAEPRYWALREAMHLPRRPSAAAVGH